MIVEPTDLIDCFILRPKVFGDDRGFFTETYNQALLSQNGIDIEFVQDNHSLSRDVGTLRGLHYQAPPFAQDKLVRVTAGAVLDVAVDIRKGSPSFGQHITVKLSAQNKTQLLVPKGFLHGFVTLEAGTEFLYKVSNYYSASHDGSVAFDDPTLAIAWGFEREDLILSDKDKNAPQLSDWDNPFVNGEI